MNKRFSTDQEVAAAIGELPREISPRRDVWLDIASRITANGRRGTVTAGASRWQYHALAASVTIAFVAGLLFGRQLGMSDLPAPEPPSGNFAMKAALEAGEREYQAAAGRRALGAGTDFATAPMWCYFIQIDGELDWLLSGVATP